MEGIYLTIVLAPLLAAIIAGLGGRTIGRVGAHTVTIAGVALSCALSLYVLKITGPSIPGSSAMA
jgi:NADH-quinone oxidoreductase subunit L